LDHKKVCNSVTIHIPCGGFEGPVIVTCCRRLREWKPRELLELMVRDQGVRLAADFQTLSPEKRASQKEKERKEEDVQEMSGGDPDLLRVR
jgi:hypothetical protein